jgi:DNA topoisomerase-3
MKTLVIAEKPSVAQDIVRAITPTAGKFEKHDEYFESDDWIVTSAVGHLVEIQAPEEFDVKRGKWSFANLPVIPPYFDLKPIDKTKTRTPSSSWPSAKTWTPWSTPATRAAKASSSSG